MAERTVLTNLFFVNTAELLAGGASGSPYTHLGCDSASMAGLSASSTALATEANANGFTRVAGTVSTEQTTIANDTLQVTYQFTCDTGSQAIYGAGIFIAASGSSLGAFHEWAAPVTFEIGDKVTETIKVQAKAD